MIKCPKYGSNHTRLTAYIQIDISCDLNENGTFKARPCWNNITIDDILHEQCGDVEVFCNNCGCIGNTYYSEDSLKIIPSGE